MQVVHCSGYLKLKQCNSLESGSGGGAGGSGASGDGSVVNLGLIALGYTLPPTALTEIRLSPHTFMFRASLDFKIVFLDSR